MPLWARTRLFLGPIFVCTATATGAAACRLALVADRAAGRPPDAQRSAGRDRRDGRRAGALDVNERRLGELADALEAGRPGKLFRLAKWTVRAGLALRFARARGGPWAHHVASVLYLAAGLRSATRGSARAARRRSDDEAVARMAREKPEPHLDDGGQRPAGAEVVDQLGRALLGPAAGLDQVVGQGADVVHGGHTSWSALEAKISVSAASRMRSCSVASSLAGPRSSSVLTIRP